MQPTDPTPILRPGETCWRIERANRLAVIVDAADYFATIRTVVQQAKHTVIMVGWDFDTRISLDPLDGDSEVPNELGKFLNWAVEARPGLSIHVLKWDLGMLQTLGRGSTPLVLLDWLTNRNIHLKLDHAHPSLSAHHQKIVVIDDTLAFCGGIDMTADRWDRRTHLDYDPHRVRPTTKRHYMPWHDVTTAVDGDAARALGELVRERWRSATGEVLPKPPERDGIWPEGLTPSIYDVDVAISRTMPPFKDREGIFEIEALYLAVIARTERTLYIESQYFASRRIAEAMIERLREADGPEIVVVNPESAHGWLEEEVMGSSRARLLQMVREADIHDRFRLYTPVARSGTPIYVHAKVLVMDDRLLKVGSSNLNNRSMGFDTECDLSVEVLPGSEDEERLRRRITGLRTDLLAEHLDVPNETVEGSITSAGGSLIAAIEALRSGGRSLVPFDPPEINEVEDAVLRENELLDPERPARRWSGLSRARKRLENFFGGWSSRHT